MKRLTAFVLATILILAFSSSAFAAVKASGIARIGEATIVIELDDSSSDKGYVDFNDAPSKIIYYGSVTSITVDSSTKVSISGTYKTEDGVSHIFNAVAEDLAEPGDGVDKFSITDDLGYSKSGVIDEGEIKISQ